jgi:hypothetical protein
MNSIFLVLAAFAVWRISAILVEERGPWDICYRFRKFIGIEHDGNMDVDVVPERFFPLLFSCIKCTSVWIGLLVMVVFLSMPATIFLLVIVPFGLSGVAVLIDSLTYKG